MANQTESSDEVPICEVGRSNTYSYGFDPAVDALLNPTLPELLHTLVVQPYPNYGNQVRVRDSDAGRTSPRRAQLTRLRAPIIPHVRRSS